MEFCAKTFKRRQDLKSHRTRSRHHDNKQFAPSAVAVSAVRYTKLTEQQESLPKVWCGETPVSNCWRFKYLGSHFDAQMADVKIRIVRVRQRFGKMWHIWWNGSLHLNLLRMRLYKSSVCSILTYGSEAWRLTEQVRKALNGANSKMVSIITRRTHHEEASAATCTFNMHSELD